MAGVLQHLARYGESKSIETLCRRLSTRLPLARTFSLFFSLPTCIPYGVRSEARTPIGAHSVRADFRKTILYGKI